MSEQKPVVIEANPWTELRQFTDARIALGRVGSSLPTDEVLKFGLAHAMARDAVHAALEPTSLDASLASLGLKPVWVRSRAPDRASYLLRPDLGRTLADDCEPDLRACKGPFDVVLVLADGLSAIAAQAHGAPLLQALMAQVHPAWRVAPLIVATQARVALGDDIGEALAARLVVMLIGERPGLSSTDSLGAYLTFNPRRGRSDAERNCISNIRPAGLSYAEAARKIGWLMGEALMRQLTGVELKDDSDMPALARPVAPERLSPSAGGD
jgi:ethanolamine ammonia-lyase small subunit